MHSDNDNEQVVQSPSQEEEKGDIEMSKVNEVLAEHSSKKSSIQNGSDEED